MVTASHDENGWTGVKMRVGPPLTFGPDEMSRLRDIVLSGTFKARCAALVASSRFSPSATSPISRHVRSPSIRDNWLVLIPFVDAESR